MTKQEKFISVKSKITDQCNMIDRFNYNDYCCCCLEKINRNPLDLKYYWKEFFNKIELNNIREIYKNYVDLKNEETKLNNYKFRTDEFFDKNDANENLLLKNLETIFSDIKPFYDDLYAFVRYRLGEYFGNTIFQQNESIPIHLLRNVNGDFWSVIFNITAPFLNERHQDNITNQLLMEKYNPIKMYQKAEEYFISMNFSKLPKKFWNESILEEISLNNTATTTNDCNGNENIFYFYRKNDIRILHFCEINENHFKKVYYNLGKVYYLLQLQNKSPSSYLYQFTDMKSFDKTFADIILMSINNPNYLKQINLFKNSNSNQEEKKEEQINRLYLSALKYFFRLPFYLAMDKQRDCCGLESPNIRIDDIFFADEKYFSSNFIRDFMSFAVKHQIFKSACMMAEKYDPNNSSLPLENCNFYGNFKIGNALKSMLSMAARKSWIDLVENFTGERYINGKGITEYYELLRVWLQAENAKNNVKL